MLCQYSPKERMYNFTKIKQKYFKTRNISRNKMAFHNEKRLKLPGRYHIVSLYTQNLAFKCREQILTKLYEKYTHPHSL